jgi:hypothetical protein
MTAISSAQPETLPEQNLDALRLENEVLRSFVNTSRDALFCIEFMEPVDLTAPEPENERFVRELIEADFDIGTIVRKTQGGPAPPRRH